MPRKKSVSKKITKQKQKQSTKINITIDNSKKTTRLRNNPSQKQPVNSNAYHTVPTYHILYNEPPRTLIESRKEENIHNPLAMKTKENVSIPMEIKKDKIFNQPKRIPIPTHTPFKSPEQKNDLIQKPTIISSNENVFKTPSKGVDFADIYKQKSEFKSSPEETSFIIDSNTPVSPTDPFHFDKNNRRNVTPHQEGTPKKRGRPKKQEGDPKGPYNRRNTIETPMETYQRPDDDERRSTMHLN